MIFAGLARLAVHDRDLALAQQHLGQAMSLRTSAAWAIPYVAVELRLEMAEACLGVGDPAAARELLAEIDGIRRLRPDLGSLGNAADDLHDKLASIPSCKDIATLTAAELRPTFRQT